jgi:alkylation response protein AidB-like acyl-CoA dehydrogenase
MDHWPLFYRGCLGSVGVLKEWLVRTVAAALRKGDPRLTLDRVREHELVEARLAEMAIDIVAGEQQVELTGGSREQLHSLLQMDSEAVPSPANVAEARSARPRRTSTRPGTRKPKRDAVGE